MACQPQRDGGWGWMVVVGSFSSYFIADGVAYSFGVLFTELLNHFEKGKGETAIIGAMVYGIPLIISPLMCALCSCYGCRIVGIVGGGLSAAAFCLSAFAQSLGFLCFTIGIIASFGLSMTYLSALLIVTYYFEKFRGRAIALAVTGSGLGAFAFPPFTEYLINEYSWRGAMFIIGGMCLHIIAASALYHPIEFDTPKKEETFVPEDYNVALQPPQPTSYESVATIEENQPSKVTLIGELRIILGSIIKKAVFQNITFMLYTTSTFLAYLWIGAPYVYLADWAMEKNFSGQKSAFLLSEIGISRTVGQLITGFLGDHKGVNTILLYACAIFLCGSATALLAVSEPYWLISLMCLTFGFGVSVTYSLQMICIIRLCGESFSTSAFGIFQLGQGIATLLGTPLGGWLFDSTGSYTATFVMAGCMIAASALMILPLCRK